jgi:hypothetical protein
MIKYLQIPVGEHGSINRETVAIIWYKTML